MNVARIRLMSNSHKELDAICDEMRNIADRTGGAASLTFDSTVLGTDTSIYLASYNSNKWGERLGTLYDRCKPLFGRGKL